MRIGDLVSRSWDISFKYKSLWILGLLAEGAWFSSVFRNENNNWHIGESDFLFSGMAIALAFTVLLLMLVLLILHFLSVAGLIDSVNRITRGGRYKLSQAFATGCHVFWRFVGLWLVFLMAVIGLGVALAIPVVLLFVLNTILGVLSLIIAVPVLLIGLFAFYNVYALTQRAIVARDCSIGDALSEAYWLFRRNLGPNVAVFLVFVVLAIGITIASAMLTLLIAAPFVAMALTSTAGKVGAILLGLPIVLAVLVVVEGFSGVFLNCLYTLFYFGLVEPDGIAGGMPPDGQAS
jgi:hypothetical protein